MVFSDTHPDRLVRMMRTGMTMAMRMHTPTAVEIDEVGGRPVAV